jgi:hypothetical protein
MSHLKPVARSVASQPPRPKAAAQKPAWQAAFATESDYDNAVASVVARIKSGEVQPRVPDEE